MNVVWSQRKNRRKKREEDRWEVPRSSSKKKGGHFTPLSIDNSGSCERRKIRKIVDLKRKKKQV
jgi:hypothetical protein